LTKRDIICDTTVLLYLGRIGQASLLPSLFEPVYVPEAVLLELDMGRLVRRDTIDPRDLDWAEIVPVPQALIGHLPSNRLGRGERAVIAYGHAHHVDVLGLDDLQARQLAKEMGLTVVGTLGVLLRAKRADLIPSIRPLVDAIIAEGFRLDSILYRDVLELAGEGAPPPTP
jgi:predicted nucleic acid-binding protein